MSSKIRMENIFFIVFRRMRQPLLTLIVTYAITILGLVLIPGVDEQGNTWYLSFFHAFYFVSYMATTIGFGEIPHAFSDAQRLWVTLSVYATVIVWIYAIGTLLALIRDPAFQQAVTERRFSRRIRHLREPFYLICGYGETGRELVQALIEHNQHAVVVDYDPERISELKLEVMRDYVPALCADARRPLHLLEAGLKHNRCAGVVALTNVNESNLKIAITSKLLHHDVKVICRADSHDVEANMASFGTNYIIDPYDTFGTLLSTALQAPCLYLLHQWLTGVSHQCLREPVYPPKNGRWVICGYGRFGKAVYNRLRQEGVDIVVIEATPDLTGQPDTAFVQGRGTEADTLQQAGIESAAGLVAGTDDDANNLSIVVTALELNPDLFTIARQNEHDNQSVFDELKCNIVMTPGSIVANKIRALLATPMLYDFIGLAYYQDEAWACELVSRISGAISEEVPEIWELTINDDMAHAVMQALQHDRVVTLGDIEKDRYTPERSLNCVALLLQHADGNVLLPPGESPLHAGDKVLFCAQAGVKRDMEWNLLNENVLEFLLTGGSATQSTVLRWLQR
ncbi:MAG: NAD-binding protein [Chromatiales bacterium]|jgi:Trk K+ transport system NAD-binding subunit